ncbi:MAG: hypothetical protein M9887_12315, partial [Chitinophagales bacterium]|nr:hypothetical protein [Chitinophagales bacterium]
MKNIIAILLFTFILSACGSIQKSFENQDYDKVISTVIKNLNSNKKVTDDDLRLLEESYKRIIDTDLTQIARMKASQNPAAWVDIFNRYKLVMNRQEAILAVTPIFYQDGSLLKVDEYDFVPLLEEARENASKYHYQEAQRLLASSSKADARAAYDHLDCIFYYYTDYKDAANLLKLAREKGTNHVLLSVDKNPYLFLPDGFENELFNYNYQSSFSDWTEIYIDPYARNQFDINVKLVISNSQISPGVIKENTYIDKKEVEDGWQYEYDGRGNVKKDSLGNDIKKKKYKTISAQITETTMQRDAVIQGAIEIYDYNSQRVLRRDAAQGESVFSASYATFRGDQDALSTSSIRKIRSPKVAFPTDIDMIIPATEELKS